MPYSNDKFSKTTASQTVSPAFCGHFGSASIKNKDVVLKRLICETAMFRDSKALGIVRDYILKHFPDKNDIKIVSCACSSGEEVYSLSMLLDDIKDRVHITGFDLSEKMIKRAKSGIISMFQMEDYQFQDEYLFDKNIVLLNHEQIECRKLFESFFEKYTPKSLKEKMISYIENLAIKIHPDSIQLLKYKLRSGRAKNCEFMVGNVLDIEKIIQGKADVILYRNSMYHMVSKDVSSYDSRIPIKNYREIMDNIITKLKSKLNKNGLLVFGQEESSMMGLPDLVLESVMKKHGFKNNLKACKYMNNIWVYCPEN